MSDRLEASIEGDDLSPKENGKLSRFPTSFKDYLSRLPLSLFWTCVFSVEWVITFGTAMYWIFGWKNYMEIPLQIINLTDHQYKLVSIMSIDAGMNAFDFFAIVMGYLIACPVKQREGLKERRRAVRVLEMAMFFGDVIIVAYSPVHWVTNGLELDFYFWSRMAMATSWGLLRLYFIISTWNH